MRYDVRYSLSWSADSVLQVEADCRLRAMAMAEEKLGRMVRDGKFDDPSNFKVQFDGVDTTGAEAEERYACERRYADCLADSDPNDGAYRILAEAVANCEAHPVVCLGDGLISFEYDNSFGLTCTVDDVLDRMNMRDWRLTCDEFCKAMLRKGGLDPDGFDWPMPLPKVMKVPEDDGTDVIARVCVTFKVDEKTYGDILSVVNKDDAAEEEDEGEDAPATEEEICTNCDRVIRYVPEKGKRVVTCPECGTINPLCNECADRRQGDKDECSKCELSRRCGELNKQRADALPKPEEE